jgi:Cu(I)/Ag(I) efflux system membrane fusion protein
MNPTVDAGVVQPSPAAATPNSDPFGPPLRRRGRILRWALSGGIPLAALIAVYVASRGAERPAEAGHDHDAVGADAAQPVRLTAAEAHRIGVTYAPVIAGPLDREIRTVGQVTFDETRVKSVSPKLDGWVEQLHIDFVGQEVRAGTPMLDLYSPMLVMAQEELLLAKRLESDVAAGSADVQASASALLSSARRRLAFWDIPAADVTRIERTGTVERTITLRAPVSGFVIEKHVLEGQRIMAGEALYRIADLGTVWVEGEVYEQDLAMVRVGQRAVAELEALPGEEFSGLVSYVYPTLDPETRTARVRVALSNPGLALKPGMYATLRLTGTGRLDAINVPRSAVLSTGERHLVFVRMPDGMLEPRAVEIGMTTDDRIEVLRGLTPGDTVVASATFLLDAESNLGTLLGGMGNMPGMDFAPVVTPPSGSPTPPDPSTHQE